MILLIDTHALIWFLNGDKAISQEGKKAIENPKYEKCVSMASIWEIAVKMSLGKLQFAKGLIGLAQLIEHNGFKLLPVTFDHALKVASLKFIHRDPFDRMLVAQAITDKLVIVTKDTNIQQYKVKTIW